MTTYRNQQLKDTMEKITPKENLVSANSIPNPDTTNIQGFEAYSIDNWLRLISLLNTSKLENQYYRSENETMKELKSLVDVCGKEDPYFAAQCIVYSRCLGEGMRSINHLASVYLAPYLSGKDFAKRFYGPWNKKEKKGGLIFRPDDMSEITSCFTALNNSSITNAIGFLGTSSYSSASLSSSYAPTSSYAVSSSNAYISSDLVINGILKVFDKIYAYAGLIGDVTGSLSGSSVTTKNLSASTGSITNLSSSIISSSYAYFDTEVLVNGILNLNIWSLNLSLVIILYLHFDFFGCCHFYLPQYKYHFFYLLKNN